MTLDTTWGTDVGNMSLMRMLERISGGVQKRLENKGPSGIDGLFQHLVTHYDQKNVTEAKKQ